MNKDDFEDLFRHILASNEHVLYTLDATQRRFSTELRYAGRAECFFRVSLYTENNGDAEHLIWIDDKNMDYDPAWMKARIEVDLKLAHSNHERHKVYLKQVIAAQNSLDEVLAALEEACMWLIARLDANNLSYSKDDWDH